MYVCVCVADLAACICCVCNTVSVSSCTLQHATLHNRTHTHIREMCARAYTRFVYRCVGGMLHICAHIFGIGSAVVTSANVMIFADQSGLRI